MKALPPSPCARARFASPCSLLLGAALLGLPACDGSDGAGSSANVFDDADLAAFELSAGAFSVAFDPDTLDYSLETPSGIGSTTVTATTSDPGATIEIDGMAAVSGTPSGPVTLGFGTTSIAVVVTAEDGTTTKTYTAAVERIPFNVISLSVLDGSVWPINREMVVRFNEDVDFSTVSLNTISIRSAGGVPAVGAFHLRDPSTVVFQPSCPARADLADAGLQPGFVDYVIRLIGSDGGATNTVHSVSGGLLQVTQQRGFVTSDLAAPFLDLEPGPPAPVVRAQGSALEDATHLEMGGDPDQRVYFERDASQDLVLSVPGFAAPLNLYSDPGTRVAFVIAFNQPVGFSSANFSPSRLRLEFLDASSTWRPLDARATLLANCAGSGAKVRLEPTAILPQASQIRAVVLPGFEDLVGEVNAQSIDGFAVAPTTAVEFSSLTPPDQAGDELLEGFDLGTESPASLLDSEAPFDAPSAEWGAGRLSAAYQFEGAGGPNGDFDWVIRSGLFFIFDTTNTLILGGPDGTVTTTQIANDGVVDVHDFTIEEGGTLRVQGPNPMRIHATGEVRIDGRLDLSGLAADDVDTLNTGNQVELGAEGAAGGGRGGNANDNVTGPTPRGGRGQGPFGQANRGGEGGEMGFSNANNKNARRPGGGGGGRFGRDWIGTTTFDAVSLAAGPGGDGNPNGRGAESGLSPAAGGAPGEVLFRDANDDDDFFGVRPLVTGGEITALVRGELPRLWAGQGGGGGGNAGRFFPNPGWNSRSDEKGGAGGGGAGGLHIKALGRIVFGLTGEIVARGGRGGTGENTNFLDHIGGTGGGGSGGHVILESATALDFTDGGANVDAPLRDFVLAAGPPRMTGPTEDVDTCVQTTFCCPSGCADNSNGGAGGAGVIQIHVPDPRNPPDAAGADILVPAAALLAADVLDQVTSPPAYVMMPTFAGRSRARSKWISIGEADRAPDGSRDPLRFLFAGLETSGADEGKIRTDRTLVPEMAALLQGDLEGSTVVTFLSDGVTLAFRGEALDPLFDGTTSGFSNDLYLRAPGLLREFVLRIDAGSTVGDFAVAHAVYEEGSAAPGDEELRVTAAVEDDLGTPREFFDRHVGAPGVIPYLLIPRFFRVATGGTESFLPTTTFVRILFQAAGQDGLGGVDEQNPLVDWTGDISRFDAIPAGLLRFFRFQVEFELDAQGTGLSAETRPVTLDFLRIPFVF